MDDKNEKQRRIPKLRLPGFTDEWERRKLGEIAEIIGGGTPSTNVDAYWDGDIDWYAPAEIGEQIYLNSSQRKITEEGLIKCSAKILPAGTVLFTSRAGIGKTGILTQEGCTNQGFQSIVPKKEELDSYFIFTRSEELKRYGEIVGAGSTFVEVSGKQMANMDLMMPKTMEEQQTIGNYFANLDHLITIHKRKIENFKNWRKGLLQRMFPRDGETIPEIRFSGYKDEWEQRKLGDITQRVQGNDGRMALPTLTISAGNGWLDQRDRFSSNIAGKEQKNYTLLHKGELSYNHGNSKLAKYGTVFSLRTYEEALVPRVYHSFRVTNEADADFIEYVFATRLPDKELGKLISSGARMDGLLNINYEEFMSIKITVPTIGEQKRLGDYFRKFDNLIFLHQRKLAHLKELKKGLLQQMFV